MLFLAVHLGALVADSYVHFGVADLLVPFASSWKSGAVAWGVVAFWFLIAVEVSSLMMRRLPRRTWRAIHLTSYLAAVHGDRPRLHGRDRRQQPARDLERGRGPCPRSRSSSCSVWCCRSASNEPPHGPRAKDELQAA